MPSALRLEIAHRQSATTLDRDLAEQALRHILTAAGIERAHVSLVLVGDEEMQRLNRQHLDHDFPTDVLTFVLEEPPAELEVEIIVNGEQARREADKAAWSPSQELLLYFIHGLLHAVGCDDQEPADRSRMFDLQREICRGLGMPATIVDRAVRLEHLCETGDGDA